MNAIRPVLAVLLLGLAACARQHADANGVWSGHLTDQGNAVDLVLNLSNSGNKLTGTVGGSTAWVGVFDAVLNRLSFYDPLTDLAQLAPNGVVDDLAAYILTLGK